MRIGFLMGSFDPIHIGHINMIREALNSKVVDKVVVVPSGQNPWKKEKAAKFFLRIDMARAATKPFGCACEVSDVDFMFLPPYYSNKSLNALRAKYKNDELYIICGTDTVDKIPHWKNADTEILPYFGIIEIKRSDVPSSSGAAISIDVQTTFNASSTIIRECIKNNLEIYPLVPKEVIDIIKKHNLYGNE